jgi:hypothetical protein
MYVLQHLKELLTAALSGGMALCRGSTLLAWRGVVGVAWHGVVFGIYYFFEPIYT